MSQMHHEVSQALWNLRIAHQNDCVTADGLHSTSIIIDNSNIAIEIQETAGFAANCHLPLGRTVAKKTLLEGSGYVVVEVAYFEWAACKTTEQQQRLLSGMLGASNLTLQSPFSHGPPLSLGPTTSTAALSLPSFSRPPSVASPVFAGTYPPARIPSTSAFNLESLGRSLQ